MRIWSNGKISLCQGEDAGSIPAIRPRSYYSIAIVYTKFILTFSLLSPIQPKKV